MNKKELEIKLSKLKTISKGKVFLEQYQTESKLAAEILWMAYMNGDIKEKVIADFGCGNGIFGAGALLLNARKVYFVDADEDMINLTKENVKGLSVRERSVFVCSDVADFENKVDCVVMNPPFGVQRRKADKVFLESGMRNSKVIYSIHKIESRKFISSLVKDFSFRVVDVKDVKFLLKKGYKFHVKERYFVDVSVFLLRKI